MKHISEEPKAVGTKGGLVLGHNRGILVNADLGSTAQVAKDAVQADVNNLHVSERNLAQRVNASLDAIGQYDSTYIGGSDSDKPTMLAISNAEGGRTLAY